MSQKKIITASIIIGLIVVIAIFAILKEKTTYELLKTNWKYKTITDLNNNTIKKVGTNDILFLNEDFTFTHSSITDSSFTSGVWRLADNELLLTINFEIPIDSTVYIIADNKPSLKYFSGNKQDTIIHDSGLKTIQKIIRFYVEKCTNTELILVKDDEKLVFESKTADVIAPVSKFNFKPDSILRGFLGLLVIISIAFLFSTNKRAISWRVVGLGLLIQLILAFCILKIQAFALIFETVGRIFVVILDFTKEGSIFLLGDLLNTDSVGYIFAFQVLPTIIFFAALTSLLFYLGIIQKVVWVLAWIMTKIFKISGAESLCVAGNIFLGQTESPLMIKAYLEKMNRSELMLVMSAGMATLAGGVLAAYIAFLGGEDPVQRIFFAKHLLAASVMAAPGVVVISKIIVPQTEKISKDLLIPKDKIGSNVLDAISNGTTEGLKLAANVGAMLLSFIAFIAMFNFILMKIGDCTGLNDVIHEFDPQYTSLNLRFIMGYIFAPIVGLMGVPWEDITLVGRLIGEKLIMTEFIAYVSLADLKSTGDALYGSFSSEKSIIMSTYALCGFANFASIGIQIGGIGTLAPGKRKLLSELGLRALLAGSLASLVSATIVGMIIG